MLSSTSSHGLHQRLILPSPTPFHKPLTLCQCAATAAAVVLIRHYIALATLMFHLRPLHRCRWLHTLWRAYRAAAHPQHHLQSTPVGSTSHSRVRHRPCHLQALEHLSTILTLSPQLQASRLRLHPSAHAPQAYPVSRPYPTHPMQKLKPKTKHRKRRPKSRS